MPETGASHRASPALAGDAEAFLAAIVDSADDAIIGKSLDGTILSWNPAAERMYGYSADEVLGRSVSLLIPPRHRDELVAILRHVAAGERVEQRDTARIRKDGGVLHVSVTISPVRDRAGRVVAASAVARDISEHTRHREEELRQREDFLAIAAHELKTPVTTVALAAQALRRRLERQHVVSAEQVGASLDALVGQSRRLATFVGEVVDIARLQSAPAPERHPVELAELASAVVAMFDETTEREIRLDAPPVVVRGDARRLEQAITNLVSNALAYSEADDPVDVRVRDEGDVAVVEVRDRGFGVAPKDAHLLFLPFSRIEDERRPPGVGLGLYITKRIVEAHGGDVRHETPEDGIGSRFVVRLPK